MRGRCQVATIMLSSRHIKSLELWLCCFYGTGVTTAAVPRKQISGVVKFDHPNFTHPASRRPISSKSDYFFCSDVTPWRFSRWRPSAILNFKIFHISPRDCRRVPNLLLCTKCHQNWFTCSTSRRPSSSSSSSIQGKQLLNCLALRPPIGPNALPLINQSPTTKAIERLYPP